MTKEQEDEFMKDAEEKPSKSYAPPVPPPCSAAFCEKPGTEGEWDCQCARCGSSVGWTNCGICEGSGMTEPGELYDEDPLFYAPDSQEPCHQCGGEASWGECWSSPDWCQANPLPGRESVERGRIEWFCLPNIRKEPVSEEV